MLEKKLNTPHQEDLTNIARKNFNKWESALHTHNPKKVAELYAADATFLPTVSGEFKHGQTGAEEYFEHFLEKNPKGVIIDEEIQELDSDCYLHSGMYNFDVGPEDSRDVVEARFSFVWKKDDAGEWKIIHHHSSVRPEL